MQTLYKQKPKPRKTGVSGYTAGDGKQLIFYTLDHNVIGQLNKSDIIFINSEGMMLKGYEPNGFDPTGRPKFLYQEWYIRWGNDEPLRKVNNDTN